MFNDIVTLNNMIAIIILLEEKIFENAEKETALLFLFSYTQHTYAQIQIHARACSTIFFF